jgi:hypothetical protein
MNTHEFVVCIDNHGYEVSLEMRKLYEIVVDADAEKYGQIRVIDESGEDYIYPVTAFDRIKLPDNIIEHVFLAHT